eukprot:g16675.t1
MSCAFPVLLLSIPRLRDSSVSVRRTALIVMTHLILKDMVKVKGQISEMAVLLVDGDERISSLARSFFNELSNKVRPRDDDNDIITLRRVRLQIRSVATGAESGRFSAQPDDGFLGLSGRGRGSPQGGSRGL